MRLPAYEDLSKEQDAVLTLPLDGRYLIGGAPGTGKTVVALYRASRMAREGKSLRFLMYSKLLSAYTTATASGGATAPLTASISTYHRWLSSLYWSTYRKPTPTMPDNTWAFDWNNIIAQMAEKPPARTMDHLLIDEGQDLPSELYTVTSIFLTENITVFADENQRITSTQTMMHEIRAAAGIPQHNTFTLTQNFRNTVQIHNLACWFHRGSPTGLATPPVRRGNRPTFLDSADLSAQVDYIQRYEQLNANRSIGVLVRTRSELKKILHMLNGRTHNPVHVYLSKEKVMPEFDRDGITILCHDSAKGLEFDTVFLPGLEYVDAARVEQADVMMKMYVLCTRARQDLFLMYAGETCALRDALPDDLIRKTTLKDD
ncbi:AAA family ATPase [Deinococcus gobiensis]|uniref:Superfamily I DNA and RNA helicase n=1 Tax=Deinococcus gobiensis (strain DSM 21396 / JCM 16679 / CGMCC 1.7299 / I-0) TaxID=745776 RepID=H8H3M0_DEIGI|nr:AAA family ATPase [Deinococcus gobiensis]AFD28117.1 Superfamily I DNA and RNA helicase [Deinococcus gobiensis I-0]